MLPARLDSQRLPRKPLADIGGMTMIERVWRAVVEARVVDEVIVATEDEEIAAHAERFGARVARTGRAPNGTCRVAEVVGERRVQVLNVQADMPFVGREALLVVLDLLDAGAPVATARAPLREGHEDPARVKVAVDDRGRAIGFSRALIAGHPPALHVGVYGFGVGVLPRCLAASLARPEGSERLEQLAWLEAGIEILVADLQEPVLSVDTPEDLATARRRAARSPQ